MKRIISIFYVIFLGWAFCSAQVVETVSLLPPQNTGGMSLLEALSKRQSLRAYSTKDLSPQVLSNLLWAAYGVNRSDGFRTVPSARSWNQFDVYVVKADGWYIYEPVKNILLKMGSTDLREHTGTQDFVKTAAVNLIFVVDYDRMTNSTEELRQFYSATDVGFISQNVYLYCAAEGLSTVVRAQIDRNKIREVFGLKPNQYPVLAQSVGYPGE